MDAPLKKRSLLLLIFVLAGLALFLYRPIKINNVQKNSHPLRINIYSEPPSLDPRKAYDVTSATVLQLLFDGLTRIGLDGLPHPSVAERIEVDERGLRYTFHLRQSLWSNGDPVTADDFARTWREMLHPSFPADFAQQLFVIRGAQAAKRGELSLDEVGILAPDSQTLVIELEAPTPYFLALCATCAFFPVHRETVSNHLEWANHASPLYISNGPFQLETWRHNSKITLSKNPSYWDRASVRLERVEAVMMSDERSELYMLERGELDWAGTPMSVISYDALPSLRRRGLVQSVPIGATYWYKINTRHPLLKNRRIRQALSLAMNRDEIVNYVTQGHHAPATRFIPSCLGLGGEARLSFDPDQAQHLFKEGLAELGITEPPPITISYNTSQEHQRIAQTVQHQWQKNLGLRVQLRTSDWRVHLSRLRSGDFEIARQSWIATVEDSIDMLQLFAYPSDSESGGNNETGWYDPRYAELVQQAAIEQNCDRRTELLREAEEIFLEAMPLIPIFFCDVNFIMNPNLRDCVLSKLGQLDFKWAYFSE
jgi:oligopeptide transport system substrate-binding protein